MSFQDALGAAAALVEARLVAAIEDAGDLPVHHAMAYGVRGGKGLRGFLVMQSAALHGVEEARAVTAGAAIEAVHAYSLIHDDLPCMDDDALRRGQPTVHRKWDEATAVLAGDALQALAFELLATDVWAGELCGSLARAAGARGMVLGQAMDMAAESAEVPLNLREITALQAGKTGALLTWAASAGAVMAGDDDSALRRYGDAIGLAFQIKDDILDVEASAEEIGKATGKDAGAGKATFVTLMGLEPARAHAALLVEEACDALEPYGGAADTLRAAARFVTERKK
ncbi:polyprenyl synthetase family protein [Alphaproteobacteria bacterium KMM 3653]|uniref:Geranylgeranyl diphosphate synthase n=1 Tax=Harenicola maris TaxID=2841044 RepID=A0AAP2G482_9RHOB|nr:polyprenyl synthetase family protein [Harenicola maris]